MSPPPPSVPIVALANLALSCSAAPLKLHSEFGAIAAFFKDNIKRVAIIGIRLSQVVLVKKETYLYQETHTAFALWAK